MFKNTSLELASSRSFAIRCFSTPWHPTFNGLCPSATQRVMTSSLKTWSPKTGWRRAGSDRDRPMFCECLSSRYLLACAATDCIWTSLNSTDQSDQSTWSSATRSRATLLPDALWLRSPLPLCHPMPSISISLTLKQLNTQLIESLIVPRMNMVPVSIVFKLSV